MVHCLCFILPLLVFFGGGEVMLRSLPNAYRTKAHGLAEKAPDVETLVLGASHTLMGIVPSHLSSMAYNLASVSQTLDLDSTLLVTYLPRLPRLRNVVVGVDAGILFDAPLAEGPEAFRATYYNLYMPTPRVGGKLKNGFEMASYTGAKEKLTAYLRGEGAEIDGEGWYMGYTLEKRDASVFTPVVAAARADYHASHGTDHLCRNRAALAGIYAICVQRGLNLVIVSTPTHPLYYKSLPEALTQACNETLAAFRDKKNAVVCDYSRDCRFEEEDFFDVDHLSTRGAKKFSDILRVERGL